MLSGVNLPPSRFGPLALCNSENIGMAGGQHSQLMICGVRCAKISAPAERMILQLYTLVEGVDVSHANIARPSIKQE